MGLAQRMVGKGSLTGTTGGTAAYAYILNCDPTSNAGSPFEVRFGTQRFRLTSASQAVCVRRGVPFDCGGTTMIGSGTGTLSNGGPGTIDWGFCDGGPGGASDTAVIQIRNATGTLIFSSPLAPPPRPGPFPGSTQPTGNNTIQTLP
jgi:hypothetical protein